MQCNSLTFLLWNEICKRKEYFSKAVWMFYGNNILFNYLLWLFLNINGHYLANLNICAVALGIRFTDSIVSYVKSQNFSRFWDTAYFRKTNSHKCVFRSTFVFKAINIYIGIIYNWYLKLFRRCILLIWM